MRWHIRWFSKCTSGIKTDFGQHSNSPRRTIPFPGHQHIHNGYHTALYGMVDQNTSNRTTDVLLSTYYFKKRIGGNGGEDMFGRQSTFTQRDFRFGQSVVCTHIVNVKHTEYNDGRSVGWSMVLMVQFFPSHSMPSFSLFLSTSHLPIPKLHTPCGEGAWWSPRIDDTLFLFKCVVCR